MFSLHRALSAAGLAGTLVLAACGESLSPDTVDPNALSSNVGTLVSAFNNNVAFQSLKSLSAHFPVYAVRALLGSSAPPPIAAGRAGLSAALRERVADARLAASLASPAGTLALFPSDVLGKTLVWDVATHQYVVGTLPGAPSNGIRVQLYVVDPSTGLPVEPLQQIGYVELTDESTAQTNKLGVLVRFGGSTVADYDITASLATSGITLGAAGYVKSADLVTTVTFTLDNRVNFADSSVQIVYLVSGSDGTDVRLEVSGRESSGTLMFRVSKDRNTIQINLSLMSSIEGTPFIEGTISFNGTTVATITGDPESPTIAAATGRTLTSAQIQSLLAIFDHAADFLGDFAEGVFGPAHMVFRGVQTF